jgi:hypothetical protein
MSRTEHPAAMPVDRLMADCDLRFTRRSGPGGQHRNKVETAVILTHRPTGTTAEASERRSQHENRAVALFRLRINLALEVRGEGMAGGSPSALWQSRCRGGRISVNPGHDDFPALLAEALDMTFEHAMDVKAAAGNLGCTPSQLTKFFHDEPRAFALVNRERAARGLHVLR